MKHRSVKSFYYMMGLACVLLLGPASVFGQSSWPNKPIHVVVPFAAGGILDIVARTVTTKVGTALGQAIVFDQRTGADGNIGSQFVAHAAPDGYTWLVTGFPAFTVQVNLRPQTAGYDPVRDFEPVARLADSPNVFVVPAGIPVNSLREFVTYAKAKSTPTSFATSGNGAPSHLTMEIFKRSAGIEMLHVPYKGQQPALTDLISGRVDSMAMSLVLAVPQIQAGKLKPLAMIDSERHPLLPNVPTIKELGYPEAIVVSWFGLLMPSKTPKTIVDRVNAEVLKALQSPDIVAKLESVGTIPAKPGRPEDLGQMIRNELARFGKVVKDANIKIE
jgi:tripartite-type tricarboxylate transporter receptor subunit TctC